MLRPILAKLPLLVLSLHLVSSPVMAGKDAGQVRLVRVPGDGIQPQVAVAEDGTVHMVYFHGDAAAGDVYYVHSLGTSSMFSAPVRVNSQPQSAIAAGTIRGAQLALGKQGRLHVAWNGSGKAVPKGLPNPQLPEDSPYRFSSPMLYTRQQSDRHGFEPQRNLMTSTYALDGGGAIAADDRGNVYVIWHANSIDGVGGEAGRAVFVAVSKDDGGTFSTERRAIAEPTGACGCCGLRAFADRQGQLWILYRSARETVHRDMILLASNDHATSFRAKTIDPWDVDRCVMSSAAFAETSDGTWAAWETENQIRFAALDGVAPDQPLHIVSPTPGEPTRKHPVLCQNSQGHVLVAWTEGTGWQKGGAVAWEVYNADGVAIAGTAGRQEGVPIWSFAAVYAQADDFYIVY